VDANVGLVSRPVEGLVDRQQVRQEAAASGFEVVDPLHPHRPAVLRLDRERGCVVQQEAALALGSHGAVTPDSRRRQSRRQDLLRELLHRDLVVVGVLAAALLDRPGPRHHGRDEHRRLVLRHVRRIERPTGYLGERDRRCHPRNPPEQVEAGARPAYPGDERPPGEPPHVLHGVTPPFRVVPGSPRPGIDDDPTSVSGDHGR
jgi:hypothetical protein